MKQTENEDLCGEQAQLLVVAGALMTLFTLSAAFSLAVRVGM